MYAFVQGIVPRKETCIKSMLLLSLIKFLEPIFIYSRTSVATFKQFRSNHVKQHYIFAQYQIYSVPFSGIQWCNGECGVHRGGFICMHPICNHTKEDTDKPVLRFVSTLSGRLAYQLGPAAKVIACGIEFVIVFPYSEPELIHVMTHFRKKIDSSLPR